MDDKIGRKKFSSIFHHMIKTRRKSIPREKQIWRILFTTITEKKWSGSRDFWLDRNYWKKVASSHDSGNGPNSYQPYAHGVPKTSTTIQGRDISCTMISSVQQHTDAECHGKAVLDKGNSREQVGDKSEENDMMAREILAHAELYGDIFEDWRTRWLEPTIYGRKRAIQEPFSKSSIGGADSIVVPRKKKG